MFQIISFIFFIIFFISFYYAFVVFAVAEHEFCARQVRVALIAKIKKKFQNRKFILIKCFLKSLNHINLRSMDVF